MKLKIREVGIPWWIEGKTGNLLVASPEATPQDTSDEDWALKLVKTACDEGIQDVVVPHSVLRLKAAKSADIPTANTCSLLFLMDVFDFSAESFLGDTPIECIQCVYRLLINGNDVLYVSATEQISGFLPAALSILSDPTVHIVKVIYPVTQGYRYMLTDQQIGYLYGLSDARFGRHLFET